MIIAIIIAISYGVQALNYIKTKLFTKRELGDSCNQDNSDYSDVEFQIAVDGSTYFETNGSLKFAPPVYVQRYVAVVNELENYGNLRKVVELGCSELSFFQYIKELRGVEEAIFVDIDQTLLETISGKTEPRSADFLRKRHNPFFVRVLCGNASVPDKSLYKAEAVIAIELIEHMLPDDLEDLPHCIFGVVQPHLVVLTTPNSDFNVLFTLKGFRHPDHKFEWTRRQFKDWALNIINRYPEYEVKFKGIGPGPDGSEQLGCCSQMAVFARNCPQSYDNESMFEDVYKVIREVVYPFEVEKEIDIEESICYECDKFIRYAQHVEAYSTPDGIYIPITDILKMVSQFSDSERILKKVLDQKKIPIKKIDSGNEVAVIPLEGLYWDDWESSCESNCSYVGSQPGDGRVDDAAALSDWDAVDDVNSSSNFQESNERLSQLEEPISVSSFNTSTNSDGGSLNRKAEPVFLDEAGVAASNCPLDSGTINESTSSESEVFNRRESVCDNFYSPNLVDDSLPGSTSSETVFENVIQDFSVFCLLNSGGPSGANNESNSDSSLDDEWSEGKEVAIKLVTNDKEDNDLSDKKKELSEGVAPPDCQQLGNKCLMKPFEIEGNKSNGWASLPACSSQAEGHPTRRLAAAAEQPSNVVTSNNNQIDCRHLVDLSSTTIGGGGGSASTNLVKGAAPPVGVNLTVCTNDDETSQVVDMMRGDNEVSNEQRMLSPQLTSSLINKLVVVMPIDNEPTIVVAASRNDDTTQDCFQPPPSPLPTASEKRLPPPDLPPPPPTSCCRPPPTTTPPPPGQPIKGQGSNNNVDVISCQNALTDQLKDSNSGLSKMAPTFDNNCLKHPKLTSKGGAPTNFNNSIDISTGDTSLKGEVSFNCSDSNPSCDGPNDDYLLESEATTRPDGPSLVINNNNNQSVKPRENLLSIEQEVYTSLKCCNDNQNSPNDVKIDNRLTSSVVDDTCPGNVSKEVCDGLECEEVILDSCGLPPSAAEGVSSVSGDSNTVDDSHLTLILSNSCLNNSAKVSNCCSVEQNSDELRSIGSEGLNCISYNTAPSVNNSDDSFKSLDPSLNSSMAAATGIGGGIDGELSVPCFDCSTPVKGGDTSKPGDQHLLCSQIKHIIVKSLHLSESSDESQQTGDNYFDSSCLKIDEDEFLSLKGFDSLNQSKNAVSSKEAIDPLKVSQENNESSSSGAGCSLSEETLAAEITCSQVSNCFQQVETETDCSASKDDSALKPEIDRSFVAEIMSSDVVNLYEKGINSFLKDLTADSLDVSNLAAFGNSSSKLIKGGSSVTEISFSEVNSGPKKEADCVMESINSCIVFKDETCECSTVDPKVSVEMSESEFKNKTVNPVSETKSDSRGNSNTLNSMTSIGLNRCQSLQLIKESGDKKINRFSLSCEKDCCSTGCGRNLSDGGELEFEEVNMDDSLSQSKAVDSGYPNTSERDMDTDMTPEQVDEISDNDSSFDDDNNDDDDLDHHHDHQVVEEEDAAGAVGGPPPIQFLDQVENGDVANNNRDDEGNNMDGVEGGGRGQGEDDGVIQFGGQLLNREAEVELNDRPPHRQAPPPPPPPPLQQHQESDSEDEYKYLSACETLTDETIIQEDELDEQTQFEDFDTINSVGGGGGGACNWWAEGGEPSSRPRHLLASHQDSYNSTMQDVSSTSLIAHASSGTLNSESSSSRNALQFGHEPFPHWLLDMLLEDNTPDLAQGDAQSDQHLIDLLQDDDESNPSVNDIDDWAVEEIIPGDMMGGGEPNTHI